jgi:hypothetical protein
MVLVLHPSGHKQAAASMIKQLALDVLMVSIVMFVNLPACV